MRGATEMILIGQLSPVPSHLGDVDALMAGYGQKADEAPPAEDVEFTQPALPIQRPADPSASAASRIARISAMASAGSCSPASTSAETVLFTPDHPAAEPEPHCSCAACGSRRSAAQCPVSASIRRRTAASCSAAQAYDGLRSSTRFRSATASS